jgi:hypothetical protein
MVAFADPVFSRAARAEAQQVSMRSITGFYRGTQVDIASMENTFPSYPEPVGKRSKSRQNSRRTPPTSSSAWLQP